MNQPSSTFKNLLIKSKEEESLLGYLNKLPQHPPKFKPLKVTIQPPVEVAAPAFTNYENPFSKREYDPNADITLPLCKDDFSVLSEVEGVTRDDEDEEEETFYTALDSPNSSIYSNNLSPNKSYISFSLNLENEIEEFKRCTIESKNANNMNNEVEAKDTPISIKDFPMTSTPIKNFTKFQTKLKLNGKEVESIKNLIDKYNDNDGNSQNDIKLIDFDKLLPISNTNELSKKSHSKDGKDGVTEIKSTPERIKKSSKSNSSSPFNKLGTNSLSLNNSSPSDDGNEDSFLSSNSESSIELSPGNTPSKFLLFNSNLKSYKLNFDSATNSVKDSNTKSNQSSSSLNSSEEDECSNVEFDFGEDETSPQKSPLKSIKNLPIKRKPNINSPSRNNNVDFSLELSFIPDEKRIKFNLNESSQLDFDKRPELIHNVDTPLIFDALQQFPPNTFDNGKRLRPSSRSNFRFPIRSGDFKSDDDCKGLDGSCFRFSSEQKVIPEASLGEERELYRKFIKGQRTEFKNYLKGLKRKVE